MQRSSGGTKCSSSFNIIANINIKTLTHIFNGYRKKRRIAKTII